MILFINCFITNHRLTHHARFRGYLNNPARIDVYKYMLASLAIIPYWTKTIFHLSLDTEFQDQAKSLKDYTFNLFKNVSYYEQRIESQKDWRYHLQEVFDYNSLVWFLCNDDHIFMDYDYTSITDALNILEDQKDKMASFFFSHYPEALKAVAQQNNQLASNELFYYDGGNVDSIQLVTPKVLKRWFVDNEDTNRLMPRPDWSTGFVKTDLTRHYVPIKECCRHFEGYPMVNIDVNKCPPLDIPHGFFDHKIKISYGYQQENFVYFNPREKNYRITDPKGADYKFVYSDIPMFWKPRMSEFMYGGESNCKEELRARNDALWELANSRPNQPEFVIDEQKVRARADRKTP